MSWKLTHSRLCRSFFIFSQQNTRKCQHFRNSFTTLPLVLQVHLLVLCGLRPKECLAMSFNVPSSHWPLFSCPLQLGPTALMANARTPQLLEPAHLSLSAPTTLIFLQSQTLSLPEILSLFHLFSSYMSSDPRRVKAPSSPAYQFTASFYSGPC